MAENRPVYDVTIIGSGPGGYVAAIRAGQLGLKVALVERAPRLGGTCLHLGCIPTKAMLFAAQLLDHVREAEGFGLKIPSAEPDIKGIHRYKDGVINKMAGGIDFLMRKNKVTVLAGHGRIAGPGKVSVTLDGWRRGSGRDPQHHHRHGQRGSVAAGNGLRSQAGPVLGRYPRDR